MRSLYFYFLCLALIACTKTRAFLAPYSSRPDEKKKDNTTETTLPPVSNAKRVEGGQLPNSGFDDWYGKDCYFQPGKSASTTLWSSGNPGYKKGVAGACGTNLPTAPGDGVNGKAAVLITKEVELGRTVCKGIAAGNIFTGSFYIDPSAGLIPNDNQVRPVLGTPYTGFPIAFSFRYKYEPGNYLKNGCGGSQNGSDGMDAYVILEHRDQKGKAYRLAVGWLRSGTPKKDWTEQRVDMKYSLYGAPPDDLKPYEERVLKYGSGGNPSKKASEQALVDWGDTTTLKTNFIVVTFSSSYQGDDFIGAPGSKLIVDDFKLIYPGDDEKEAEKELEKKVNQLQQQATQAKSANK